MCLKWSLAKVQAGRLSFPHLSLKSSSNQPAVGVSFPSNQSQPRSLSAYHVTLANLWKRPQQRPSDVIAGFSREPLPPPPPPPVSPAQRRLTIPSSAVVEGTCLSSSPPPVSRLRDLLSYIASPSLYGNVIVMWSNPRSVSFSHTHGNDFITLSNGVSPNWIHVSWCFNTVTANNKMDVKMLPNSHK